MMVQVSGGMCLRGCSVIGKLGRLDCAEALWSMLSAL